MATKQYKFLNEQTNQVIAKLFDSMAKARAYAQQNNLILIQFGDR